MMYYIQLLDQRKPKISLDGRFWGGVASFLNYMFTHERQDEEVQCVPLKYTMQIYYCAKATSHFFNILLGECEIRGAIY